MVEKIVNKLSDSLKKLSPNIFEEAYSAVLADKDRPSWCLLPAGTCMKIVYEHLQGLRRQTGLFDGVMYGAHMLSCIGAWRLTKDIIRLDETVKDTIISTQFTGDLPVDLFFHMPSWCMYVEFMTPEYIGFFFLLENAEEPELRIWWVKPEPLEFVSIPIRLGNWTLQEAVKKANEYARRYSRSSQTYEDRYLTEAVNIIIYLCSENAEYAPGEVRPVHPQPRKTKRGIRFFPADKPKIWQVGKQTGEKLRTEFRHSGNSKNRRPHIRRAHWHGYWTGAKTAEKRNFIVKWIPPVFVRGERISGIGE